MRQSFVRMGRVGKRKLVPRQTSFKSVAYLMLVPVAGILLFFLWNFLHGSFEPIAVLQSAIPRKQKPPAPRRADIVLILDDVGFDRQPMAPAMAIDPNVNFAVLPNSRNAREVASALHARGFEVLCHLPMEPEGYPAVSPGAGAVLTTMSDAEIARATRANIGSVPFARGVNNHMGSRATADRRVMTSVLGALPDGMYFIDSKTTGNSVAGALAHSMHVKTASRNIFLDDVQSEAEIRRQLASLTQAAEEHGVAVGIGHMYPSTIKVLGDAAPSLRARGVRFVRASAVVD
ncbi:MAG: divergent polysaccharide deacetylase family protein [Acidobacteriota bacterium]